MSGDDIEHSTIRYKKGRCNCDADLLSRCPFEEADIDEDNQPTECQQHK